MKNKIKVGDSIYIYDENRRIYEKDGVRKNSPYYEEHFYEYVINDENDKEYVFDFGVINKRSGLALIKGKRQRYYTDEEKNDNVYIDENKYKIIDRIKRCNNASILKKISKIIEDDNKL